MSNNINNNHGRWFHVIARSKAGTLWVAGNNAEEVYTESAADALVVSLAKKNPDNKYWKKLMVEGKWALEGES